MKEFTYSEARQQFSALLERAGREGAVRIRRRDGRLFVLRPEQRSGSPLDVPGLDLNVSPTDIVAAIHESRRTVEATPETRHRTRARGARSIG